MACWTKRAPVAARAASPDERSRLVPGRMRREPHRLWRWLVSADSVRFGWAGAQAGSPTGEDKMAGRKVFASCLAMALAGTLGLAPMGGALAQSGRMGSTQATTVYTALEPALIIEVLEEAGFETTVEQEEAEDGSRHYIILGSQNGFVMGVNLRVCDTRGNPRGCLGVNFFTLWDVRRGQVRDAGEAADLFNEETLYGRLTVNDSESSIYYSHYMIVDHGVTRDNVAANLSLFLSMCQIIVDEYMGDILDLGDGGERRGK